MHLLEKELLCGHLLVQLEGKHLFGSHLHVQLRAKHLVAATVQ